MPQDDTHQPPAPWLAGLLLLHCLPFATRPALIGGDEVHYALMAHSIAIDGDVELSDDYRQVEAGSAAASKKRAAQTLDRHLVEVDGREVFAHPLGLPLLTAPLVALQQRLAPGSAPDLALGVTGLALTFWALLAGWRLAWRRLDSSRAAALVVFGAYFSSPLWYYSRTFFTEPYTWAFAVLALAALARDRLAAASLGLALALAMKETALLLVAPILAWVAWSRGLGAASRLAIGPLVFAVLFVIKNLLLVGRPLATFQPFRLGDPLQGALGLLVDPARGLLLFAPLLCLGALGWWPKLRGPRTGSETRWALWAAALAFLGYLSISASWIDWRGGTCWGPRLLVPALPALVLPLIELFGGAVPRWLAALLAAAFLAGFTVQWSAALDPVTAFWSTPASVMWKDSPVAAVSGALLGLALMVLVQRRFPDRRFSRS